MSAAEDRIELGIQSSLWRVVASVFNAVRTVQLRAGELEFNSRSRNWRLAHSDIADLTLTRGLIGVTLTAATNTAALKIRGLDAKVAQGFYETARQQWIDSLKKQLDQWQDNYRQSLEFVDSLN